MDFSLHLVDCASNNLLPPEANILRSCIMLIHKLRTVDEQGYYTRRSWTKTDMTFFLMNGRQLTANKDMPLWYGV